MLSHIKRSIVICFAMIITISLTAQKEDYTWYMGYHDNYLDLRIDPDTFYTPFIFDFNHDPMQIIYQPGRILDFSRTNSSICNPDGTMFCYSNGFRVDGANNTFLPRGDTINYGDSWEDASEIRNGKNYLLGLTLPQGMLMLPWPDRPDSIYMMYSTSSLATGSSPGFKYGIISKRANDGYGAVILKDVYIEKNALRFGSIASTRHANGRDWWITVISRSNDTYYVYLLQPSGLSLHSRQKVGYFRTMYDAGTSAAFSPDGSHYASIDGLVFDSSVVLSIFDFDRCTGLLSQGVFDTVPYFTIGTGFGMTFSPDSRYLYANTNEDLFQYDMDATDRKQSRELIASNDGFQSIPHEFLFRTTFGWWAHGPDGKLYSVSSYGTALHMHTMHFPNERGQAADFRQHDIRVSFQGWGIPNFPNYRLGPLDGSPCDTLGLDNYPIAKYRYEGADTIDFRHIRFTDLSYFRPTRWVWDFGDGTGELEAQSPYHRFARNGTYNVCLTVSNEYSSNTTCRLITLGTTSTTQDTRPVADISVFPNPAVDYFNLTLGDYVPARGTLTLHALSGVVVHTQRVYYGQNSVNITDLPTGMYVYRLTDEGQLIGEGKVVVR